MPAKKLSPKSSFSFVLGLAPYRAVSGCGRDDCCDLPTEFLRLDCKSPARVIAKSHSSIANVFSKNPIFLHEVRHHMLLILIQPSGNGDDEKGKWVENRLHKLSDPCRTPDLANTLAQILCAR
jgi:hypothetical protein